jgi:flotillin
MPAASLSYEQALLLVALAMISILLLMMAAMIVWFYKKVPPGTALVRFGLGGTCIATNSAFVFPIFHRAEWLDLTIKRVEVKCEQDNALVLSDGSRANATVSFFVCLDPAPESIRKVVQHLGIRRTRDGASLQDLLRDPFSLTLGSVARQHTLEQINDDREAFCKDVLDRQLDSMLSGMTLHTVAIRHLGRAPMRVAERNGA